MDWKKQGGAVMEILDYILLIPGIMIACTFITAMITVNHQSKKKRLLTETEPEKIKEKEKKVGTDRSDWWWGFFKPHFSVPVSWAILHLIFALTAPKYFKEVFTNQLGLLTAIEIMVFVLNSILNKDTKFEERFSRGIMTFAYSALLIVVFGTIWNRASAALEPKSEPEKSSLTVTTLTSKLPSPARRMSGTFILPPGELVDRDRNGQILAHLPGERTSFIQLHDPPEKFWYVGGSVNSYTINSIEYTTGKGITSGTIVLKGDEKNKKTLVVQARILP